MARDARYFDSISQHFLKNIYTSDKGKIRLAVLKRDLAPYVSDAPKQFLDVGGGAGQMALWLANLGHEVTLVDFSGSLLKEAQAQASAAQLSERLHLIQGDAVLLDYLRDGKQFDGVLCHAVIEWVENARGLMNQCCAAVRHGGFFSLMYYNHFAQEFMQHVYGNFAYIDAGYQASKAAKLTPDFAQNPQAIASFMAEHPDFTRKSQTGIRVFSDLMREPDRARSNFTEILNKELALSLRAEFIPVSRYVHEIYQRH